MSTQTDKVLQLAAAAQTLSNRVAGTGDARLEEARALAARLADTLAGLTSGDEEPGGSGGDGYDPVKEGKAMAAKEKGQSDRQKDLAFR